MRSSPRCRTATAPARLSGLVRVARSLTGFVAAVADWSVRRSHLEAIAKVPGNSDAGRVVNQPEDAEVETSGAKWGANGGRRRAT